MTRAHSAEGGALPVAGSQTAPSGKPPKPIRITELEGVRGIFSMLVLWGHAVVLFSAPFQANFVWLSMELFFCMSGYFIAGQAIDNRRAGHFWSVYIRRRMLRIWPLYFTVLVTIALFSAILVWKGSQSHLLSPHNLQFVFFVPFVEWYAHPAHATAEAYNYAFVHAWSVAMEEQFYLIAPLAAWFLPVRGADPKVWTYHLRWICVIPVPMLVSLGLRVAGYDWWLLLARMDAFVVGIGIAWLERCYGVELRQSVRFRRLLAGALPVAFLAMGAWCLAEILAPPAAFYAEAPHQVYGVTLIALVSGVIVSVCAFRTSPVFLGVLRWPLFQYLGKISYSTYLWHLPILVALARVLPGLGWPFTLQALLAIAIVLGLGSLSYTYIEEPWLRKKRPFH